MKFLTYQKFLGAIALVLGLTATALSYHTQINDDRRNSCQTKINQEFLATLKERATINNNNTNNINGFVVALINSASYTKAQDAAVIKAYLTELATINGDLKAATYPDIGNC